MSVNIYKTTVGLFSVIADDAIYSLADTEGRAIEKGVITPYGDSILKAYPLQSLYTTILKYKFDVADAYNELNKLIKVVKLYDLPDVNGETKTKDYLLEGSSDKYIHLTYRYERGEEKNLFTTAHFLYNNNYTSIGSTLQCPYGHENAYYNSIELSILISDYTMSHFKYCTFVADGETKYVDFKTRSNIPASYVTNLKSFFSNIKPITESEDPFTNGGNTVGGGGGGTFGGGNTIFGGASDSIDIPPLPTASASSAGFITLFNPSLAQLNNLANYMWSDLLSLDTFKKIFADPMDCILGLSIIPVKPASA